MDVFIQIQMFRPKSDLDPSGRPGSDAVRYVPLTGAVYTEFSSGSENVADSKKDTNTLNLTALDLKTKTGIKISSEDP